MNKRLLHPPRARAQPSALRRARAAGYRRRNRRSRQASNAACARESGGGHNAWRSLLDGVFGGTEDQIQRATDAFEAPVLVISPGRIDLVEVRKQQAAHVARHLAGHEACVVRIDETVGGIAGAAV